MNQITSKLEKKVNGRITPLQMGLSIGAGVNALPYIMPTIARTIYGWEKEPKQGEEELSPELNSAGKIGAIIGVVIASIFYPLIITHAKKNNYENLLLTIPLITNSISLSYEMVRGACNKIKSLTKRKL